MKAWTLRVRVARNVVRAIIRHRPVQGSNHLQKHLRDGINLAMRPNAPLLAEAMHTQRPAAGGPSRPDIRERI